MTEQEALDELQRRGITVSSESVLDEKGTTFEEFKKGAESLLKGSAKGIVDIIGGWGNLYDYLKKSKDPSALSSAGIVRGIKDLTGLDLLSIQGYRGAYDVGAAGAPAAALTMAGLPGLFPRSAAGAVGEFAVGGGTGLMAQAAAPESPLAQIGIQSLPYAARGGVVGLRDMVTRPTGEIPANVDQLLRVGRMTPGEMTGNRPQLARETSTELNPKIGERGNVFRQAQARDVETFLTDLVDRTTSNAVSPTTASDTAFQAFTNYGKALSGKLRADATRDFNRAKNAGGTVSTSPVVKAVQEELSRIPPEAPGMEMYRASLQRIVDEYTIPAQPGSVTPSTILGPTGQPASVTVTPGVPAGLRDISIERLQKNLSAWGEAAFSGSADFGKGNIFAGVAPGQAKGIAIKVLRGFRESLDDAINQGVPGAAELAKARDSFKANLANIEEYANKPLTKYFDVENPSALTPEKVIDKLASATPSERMFLAQVLNASPDGYTVLDTVRRSQLNQVLEKARKAAAGAPAGAPTIDTKVLLKELNNKRGDFNYLFANSADASEAALAIEWLQKQIKTASDVGPGPGADAYGATRGLGGTSQQGLIARELAGLARLIMENPQAMADVIFNPQTVRDMAKAQRTGTLRKGADIATSLAGSLAKFAPRVGPMAETTQPADTSQVPVPAPEPGAQMTPEDAIQELKARGIEF